MVAQICFTSHFATRCYKKQKEKEGGARLTRQRGTDQSLPHRERMLRQRTKEWGFQKSRREREMKAALRVFRVYHELRRPEPKVTLRGEPITPEDLKEFFRKKPTGCKYGDMPTPSPDDISFEGLEITPSTHVLPSISRSEKSFNATGDLESAGDPIDADRNITGPSSLSSPHSVSSLVASIVPYFLGTFRNHIDPLPNLLIAQRSPSHPRILLRMWGQLVAFYVMGRTGALAITYAGVETALRCWIEQDQGCVVIYVLLLRVASGCDTSGSRWKVLKSSWNALIIFAVQQADRIHGRSHPLSTAMSLVASFDLKVCTCLRAKIMRCLEHMELPSSELRTTIENDEATVLRIADAWCAELDRCSDPCYLSRPSKFMHAFEPESKLRPSDYDQITPFSSLLEQAGPHYKLPALEQDVGSCISNLSDPGAGPFDLQIPKFLDCQYKVPLQLPNWLWVPCNVDPGVSVVGPYFVKQYSKKSKDLIDDQKSCLDLWIWLLSSDLTTNVHHVAREGLNIIDQAVCAWVKNESPCFVLYLLLILGLYSENGWCATYVYDDLLGVWRFMVKAALVVAEREKGRLHPLTIAIGIAASSNYEDLIHLRDTVIQSLRQPSEFREDAKVLMERDAEEFAKIAALHPSRYSVWRLLLKLFRFLRHGPPYSRPQLSQYTN